MHIRIIPAIIVLSLLALVATACSVASGAQPGPALASQMAAIASPAPAASEAKGTSVPAAGQPVAAPISLPAETRTDAEGSVTVAVTPAGGTAGALIFDVSMDTHSVELDYDMTKIATLRDDQGRTYAVKEWNGAAGGHHREGSITFELPTGAAPKWLELSLTGVSGVPSRLFKWEVK